MRQRLDLAEAMLAERALLSDVAGIKRAVMDEFQVVLTQMPYVGGTASRMERLLHALHGIHGDRPGAAAARRLAGRDRRNRAGDLQGATAHRARGGTPRRGGGNSCRRRIRLRCARMRKKALRKATGKRFRKISSTTSVAPGPGDSFEFGIDYKSLAAFANSRRAMATGEIPAERLRARLRSLCNARDPPGTDANLGRRREPLQFPVLAASVGVERRQIILRADACRAG